MKLLVNLDKGILGVPDSYELWQEILSHPKMFEACSKAKNILVVAGGHGTEVDVLVDLHGEGITKRITFNDQFACFTNLIMLKYHDITVLEGDFVTQTKTFNRQFEVIIGNPPYQDGANKAKNNKLWHKFVTLTDTLLQNNGVIGFVTPSSIFINYVGFGKKFCETILKRYRLLMAVVHTPKQYFDVGVETSHWIIEKSAGEHEVEIPVLRDPIIQEIVDIISNHSDKLELVHENPSITKAEFGKGEYEIYQSGKNKTRISTLPVNSGQLKIVFPFSAKYESQFVTTEPTCHFNRVYYVVDQQEANNIMSYTLSKLYRFYAQFYLKTAGFTPAVKNSQMPLLDTSKQWTDDELYDYFKLSNEQIEYVENYFK